MNLVFSSRAWDDLKSWERRDRRVRKRIEKLIDDCLRSPFSGIGKPEPLRGDRSGFWSRRITDEHRLVYRVTADAIMIESCVGHYE